MPLAIAYHFNVLKTRQGQGLEKLAAYTAGSNSQNFGSPDLQVRALGSADLSSACLLGRLSVLFHVLLAGDVLVAAEPRTK